MNDVLVTGAGRGIGLEFTRQLLERGDRVFATVRSLKRAKALHKLRSGSDGRLHIMQLDVAEPESIATLSVELRKLTERLDVLINNAGIGSKGVPKGTRNARFGSLEPTGIERMIRVNAIGPVLLTQALADLLKAGEDAKVIALSSSRGSITAKTGGGNYGYSTSKATLNMLTRAMAFDVAPMGIISVVIDPGWVATDMGGPNGELTPEASVSGMLRVLDGLSSEDAGRFFRWDGSEHAW